MPTHTIRHGADTFEYGYDLRDGRIVVGSYWFRINGAPVTADEFREHFPAPDDGRTP